jgi:hypothetical protein
LTSVVLDAGALIALERGARDVWGALKRAGSTETDVLVPAAALAQVWRGRSTQAALALALRDCVIASFDAMARDVGELCGRTRTTDVCDAQVALVAARWGDELWTSDPSDMRRLLAAIPTRRRIAVVHC